MHVTILSGRVSEENWRKLESDFERVIKHPPPGVVSSMLVQCLSEPKLWQVITTWESVDIYHEAKERKMIDVCFDLFCNAGSSPHRNEFSVFGKFTRV